MIILDMIEEYRQIEKLFKAENFTETIGKTENLLQQGGITEQMTMELQEMLGRAYTHVAQYHKALEVTLKALVYALETQDNVVISKIYLNLIFIYQRLDDAPKAIEYGYKALEVCEQLKDLTGIARAYNSLGVMYKVLGEDKIGEECFYKALENKEYIDDHAVSAIYMNLATIAIDKQEYQEAISIIKTALEVVEKSKNKYQRGYAYKMLSKAYKMLEDLNQAKYYIKVAIELQAELDDIYELSECYCELSDIYERQENYMLALKYHKKYHELVKELFIQSKQEQIREMEREHEHREKEVYIEQNKKLKQLNKNLSIAYRHIKKLSELDALTEILNRRGFEKRVRVLKSKMNPEEQCSILMIDVDNFKQINDVYGHDIGDKILVKTAKILNEYVGEEGIVGRFGGEEFITFLPSSTHEKAIELAEQIRKTINRLEYEIENNKITFTITVGVDTSYKLNFKEQVKRADYNLYIGKKSGKNCVI